MSSPFSYKKYVEKGGLSVVVVLLESEGGIDVRYGRAVFCRI